MIFIETFIDPSSKVNTIQPSFIRTPGFCIYKFNIYAQKIDCNWLKTYGKVIAWFQLDNKDKKFYFFEKTILLAYIYMNVIFGISFPILSNVKINFNNQILR